MSYHWFVSTGILAILIVIVVTLWIWLPAYLTKDIEGLSDKAAFGDSYGAVSALFTGLAFAGLVFTILLQQREIKLQREDFVSQLEEMKLSREEVGRQMKAQENHTRLGLAELRMKCLEVEIAKIEMQSLQWTESARFGYCGSQIEAVKSEMLSIMETLEDDLDEKSKV